MSVALTQPFQAKGNVAKKNACPFTLNALGAWLLLIQATEKDMSKN